MVGVLSYQQVKDSISLTRRLSLGPSRPIAGSRAAAEMQDGQMITALVA